MKNKKWHETWFKYFTTPHTMGVGSNVLNTEYTYHFNFKLLFFPEQYSWRTRITFKPVLFWYIRFLLQTCCMAQTAHSWTPGVVKQPSNGKNGLKDLKVQKKRIKITSYTLCHFLKQWFLSFSLQKFHPSIFKLI